MKNRLALALAAAGGYALGRVNKAALTSALVTKRLSGLADTLHDRTAGLRDRLDPSGLSPLGGGKSGDDETDGPGKADAARKTAGRKTTSAASTAKKAAKKPAASKPAAKKTTAGKTAAKKAPGTRTTAKRTGGKRTSSAKDGRASGSGGDDRG